MTAQSRAVASPRRTCSPAPSRSDLTVTLRPENTAGVVRAVAEHSMLYDGGKRLYYMGPMFRHERPQRGR